MSNDTKKLYRRLILAYLRLKDSQYYSMAIYTVVLLVSVILVFYVVIPEVGNWLSVQAEIQATKQRIAVMQDNIRLINSIDATRLDEDFQTATAALPPERDISHLLESLDYASVQSSVSLNDFHFEVGQISSRSIKDQAQQIHPDAKITFSVSGPLQQIQQFIGYIQEKMPLLSVSTVEASFLEDNVAKITLSYYFKALPSIKENVETPLTDVTADNRILLDKLKSWRLPLSLDSGPIGSAAAEPL